MKKTDGDEMALMDHLNNLPSLKKEWIRMGIQFCADEVVEELAKDY